MTAQRYRAKLGAQVVLPFLKNKQRTTGVSQKMLSTISLPFTPTVSTENKRRYKITLLMSVYFPSIVFFVHVEQFPHKFLLFHYFLNVDVKTKVPYVIWI